MGFAFMATGIMCLVTVIHGEGSVFGILFALLMTFIGLAGFVDNIFLKNRLTKWVLGIPEEKKVK